MISSTNNFSLTYENKLDKLYVMQNQQQMGELIADDFRLEDRFTPSPLNKDNSPIHPNTRQMIRCLKIQEKRLLFAKHHPVANGFLSIISCICLPILSFPWALGLGLSAFGGSGPHNPMSSYVKSSQRAYNWLQPVFNGHEIRTSMDMNRKKLIVLIDTMNSQFNEKFFADVKKIHETDIENYGKIGWQSNRQCKKNYNDMIQAQKIVKNVFNRNFNDQPEI